MPAWNRSPHWQRCSKWMLPPCQRRRACTNKEDVSDPEREALEYVRDIKGFYSHVIMYLIGAPAMVIASLFDSTDFAWYIWPIIGWGIGVAAHGLVVFEVFFPVRRRLGEAAGREAASSRSKLDV